MVTNEGIYTKNTNSNISIVSYYKRDTYAFVKGEQILKKITFVHSR